MPDSYQDAKIKQLYVIAYFKRNFWLKVREIYYWGFDENDITVMKDAWKLKAETLGVPGLARWAEIEAEWDEKTKQFQKASFKGIAWQQNKEPYRPGKRRNE